MAHDLNIEQGVATMAYVGEMPWHSLGQKVSGEGMTARQAVEAAHFDFNVSKRPISYQTGDTYTVINKKVATVRDDTNAFLGIVGSGYQVLQNTEAFEFFDTIVGEGQAIYETVGALGRGERIWILAKLPNDIIVNNLGVEETTNLYILLYNSHNGESAITARLTPVRVVCQNTLNISLRDNRYSNTEVRIIHTKNMMDRLRQAHNLMGIVSQQVSIITEVYNKFAAEVVTDEVAKEFCQQIVAPNKTIDADTAARTTNIIDQIYNLYKTGNGNNGQNVWSLYNGVTQYVDHTRSIKNGNRWESGVFGSGFEIKDRAFRLAAQLVPSITVAQV